MTLIEIDAFLATVDPSRATVVSFPKHIAVFGRTISSKKLRAKATFKPKSQRDAFVHWISTERPDLEELLLLPESFKDWSNYNVYSDLLLFEKDLGYLTSAVVVFLEGPGAIAELGAFSQIPSLRERLLVVVNSGEHPKDSFISLGPLRSIKETHRHADGVCVVPTTPLAGFVTHIPAVIDVLDNKRALGSAEVRFDSGNEQHQILLVLDLINLFSVIQAGELLRLALHFVASLDAHRIKQILYLLQKVELITCEQYGKVDYYVPRKFRDTYIDYTALPGTRHFVRDRTKTLAWEHVQKDQFRRIAFGLAARKAPAK